MKLPFIRINLESMLLLADKQNGVMTYPSEIEQLGYAANTESVLILTKQNGYLGVRKEDIDTLVSELLYIREEIERLSRCLQ